VGLDLGFDHDIDVVGTDDGVEEGEFAVEGAMTDGDFELDGKAVLAEGDDFVGRLLEPDVINIHPIPRHDEVEAFAVSVPKIGAAEESFPQDAGLAGAEAHEDTIVEIGPKEDREEREQEPQAYKVAPN
jgi:hypothetical protein